MLMRGRCQPEITTVQTGNRAGYFSWPTYQNNYINIKRYNLSSKKNTVNELSPYSHCISTLNLSFRFDGFDFR